MHAINKNKIENIIGLTPMQEGMLFHYLKDSTKHQYFEQMSLKLSGPLNFETLNSAWQFVIDGNEMLRAAFRWEKMDKPVQLIQRSQPFKMHMIDFTAFSMEERENKLEAFRYSDRENSFDLQDIAFRVTLCKIDENRFEMIISNHHIIYDGWSNGIILKELFQAYRILSSGGVLEKSHKTTFKEFVKWTRSRDIEKQRAYWSHYLKGFDTQTELSVKGKDNTEKSVTNTQHLTQQFSEDVEKRLDAFIKQEKITLAALFYCAWGILLQNYNNCNDVILGTTVSGRSAKLAGIEQIVGLFINTIPLRVQSGLGEKIRDLLTKVDNALQTREEYEHTSLIDIKESSPLQNNEELFDTLMIIENYPLDIKSIGEEGNISIDSYRMNEETHYDLVACVTVFEQIQWTLSYQDTLFSENSIKSLSRHFSTILEYILHHPQKEVSQIDFLSEEEKNKIVFQFNDTSVEYAKDKTIHRLFEEQVEKNPNNIAVTGISPGENQGSLTLTYSQLNEKANQLARLLMAKGMKESKIVGLMPERTPYMLVGLLAILKAGGAYIPISREYPEERVSYILEECRVDILLTDTTVTTPSLVSKVIALTDPPEGEYDSSNLSPISTPDHLAYIIYTSGTTGKPKGVMIENRAFINFVKGITDHIPFNQKDAVLSLTTITFDIFGLETILPLLKGSRVVMGSGEEQVEAQSIAAAIRREEITIFQVTPSRLQLIITDEESSRALSSLKYLIIGGEALPPLLLDKTREITAGKVKIYNVYGPTETTVWSTIKEVSGDVALDIGKPIANTQIYILNNQGNLQPIGVPGEICIGGDGVARGYVNRPKLTSEKFIHLPISHLSPEAARLPSPVYKTGDLGIWLDNGDIQCLGRLDHQVKIRGFRIELGEIEIQIQKFHRVKDAVVTVKGLDDNKFLCAYIQSDDSLSSYLPELTQFLMSQLPDYMMPAYFIQIDEIPLNQNGKVDRKQLPDPEMDSSQTVTPPGNDLERSLVQIWSEILERKAEHIGIEDNFFHLGGHSLKSIALVAKIHKKLNVKIPLSEIFKYNTIKAMAQYISTTDHDAFQQIEPLKKQEYYEPSYGQKRVWALSRQSKESSLSFNMPGSYPFYEEVDKEALQNAFIRIIQRHESLRTCFVAIDDEVKQQILPPENLQFQIPFIDLQEIADQDSCLKEMAAKERETPFDLQHGPLLRASLVKVKPEEYILFFTMHHIISDYISMEILKKEFFQLYKAYQQKEEPKLTPLPIQYKDFAHWQNLQLTGPNLEKLRQYWWGRFNNQIPLIELPYDKPRLKIHSNNGERVEFTITSSVTRLLRSMGNDHQATLFMVLFASIDALLFFYSSQNDIVIGIPSSGREHPDLAGQIGFYINTLALRIRFKEEDSFLQLLSRVKQVTAEAYEHQMYPFDLFIEELKFKREPGRHPLFDVVIDMLNLTQSSDTEQMDTPEKDSPPVKMEETITIKESRSKFDFTVYFHEEINRIHVAFEYNTDLFEQKTIIRMAKRYQKLLETIIKDPGKTISQLCLEDHAKKPAFGSFLSRKMERRG